MSPNRKVIYALICVLVGSAGAGVGGDEGDKTANPNKTSLVLEKPLPVDAKADEVTRLLIERRNAAVELVQATYALLSGGKGSMEQVAAAAERALAAQMDVPNSDKIQILEQHVKFARELDEIVDGRFNQGVVDVTSQRLAKYLRLDMELRLARAKLGAK